MGTMADDPYQILGVPKTAGSEDIRAAYRRLAKQHHPDLNPGDKAAEERFKQISAANEILSDTETRARFDRGEIDGGGAEREPPRAYRHYAQSEQGGRYARAAGGAAGGEAFGGGNFEDLFASIFEAGGRAGNQKAADARYALEADFLAAVNGATRRLTLPDGQVLDVKIPPGTETGDVLRLRGRGHQGGTAGEPGDALIEITVSPHRFFRREGRNIYLDLPVSLKEAVLGGRVSVPTPAGAVMMTLKPNLDPHAELRLRARGVPAHGKQAAGDLLIKPHVEIGPPDARLAAFLLDWNQEGFDPRAGFGDVP